LSTTVVYRFYSLKTSLPVQLVEALKRLKAKGKSDCSMRASQCPLN
jgi:hypothetical protein